MNEASSLDDALKQLNCIWGTENNIFEAYDHPLYETDEDLLYRQVLKDLQRKYPAESIITNTIPVSALKGNVSLNTEGGRIEKIMTSARTLLHAETRDETTLVREETDLLEEPTYECLTPLKDQCDENLTTCSVSNATSYECTSVIEPFKASVFLAMVAFAKDRHFDRQAMTECLPILRTFGIIDSHSRGIPDQTI